LLAPAADRNIPTDQFAASASSIKQCAGVSDTGYRRLGDSRKNAWRCPKYKSSPSPTPGAVSPQPNQLDRIQEQLNKITFDLAPLASLVADVRSIKTELNGLKESLDIAHELISNFSNKVNTLEARIVRVEKVACQANKTLLSKARTLAKENNFQFIWVKQTMLDRHVLDMRVYAFRYVYKVDYWDKGHGAVSTVLAEERAS
ncbi:Apolipoprotein A1/A4/E, partial [Operophtera brumata]